MVGPPSTGCASSECICVIIRPMRVKHIIGVSDQGVSRPYQCHDENGELRWCKGDHTGLRAVMSEWLCARMGQSLDLPVPTCDVLYLDPRCFDRWRADRASLPVLVTAANPYVFASLNVPNAKDVTDAATELVEVDPLLLARIYVFDRFIRNTDRTDFNSNLLLDGGVHVIDHNNAFDPGFDSETFGRTHVLRGAFAAADPRELECFRDRIHATVTVDFLESAWSEMPEAWTGVGREVLSLESVLKMLDLERR